MTARLCLYVILFSNVLLQIQCTNTPKTMAQSVENKSQDITPAPNTNLEDSTLKMRGLSFVAPPQPFSQAPMMDVKAVNADWIAVIPYGFTRPNTPKVHYEAGGFKWWGERMDGVKTTIDSAHRAGINVMLKPQVYVPGGWTGGLDYASETDWAQWESDYEKYILPFAEVAENMKVRVFCIGTEFKMGVTKRETFWRNLIQKVRSKYSGKLVYAANWDEYPVVPFWDALDYVGINAYFPLIPDVTPSVSALQEAWKPYFNTIKAFQNKVKKPILFTEFGYLSVDGCAFNSWEIEKRIHDTKINEQAQANALDALFATFWQEKWWQGGFLWKWFPEGQGHEGYFEKDYTPQGKVSETILKKWYKH